MKRAITDVKKAAAGSSDTSRTEKDLDFRMVIVGILVAGVFTFLIYNHFAQNTVAALVATVVMIIAGFFFAAVSGYLVGLIGSSNNPISGLTISTLVVAAILMVLLGMKGQTGVAAVLGVAAVVCVAAAVAGEMLQDLKVGHILGGTPWKMQIGDLIGVVISSLVMVFPLIILHEGDIKMGGEGFGGKTLAAPQAGLMAMLSKGIVGGEMAWPLIIVGMIMAVGFILIKVKSPMLVSVGMYLPFETTSAIFLGGMVRWVVDFLGEKRGFNKGQKEKAENTGVLVASGLIAGEALIGLVFAAMAFFNFKTHQVFANPSFIVSTLVICAVGFILVYFPFNSALVPDAGPREEKPDVVTLKKDDET